MANTPTTTLRLDPELRDEALQILEPLGLNLTSATNIFLKAVVREKACHSTSTRAMVRKRREPNK